MSAAGAILLKLSTGTPWSTEHADRLGRFADACPSDCTGVAAYAALENGEVYAYISFRGPTIDAAASDRIARAFAPGQSTSVRASRLDLIFDAPGASRGEDAPFHYVVETDVAPEHEADLNAWYDTEHMPGLAGCPGSARARRFRNPEGSPRYHACYDLVRAETLGSAPWLAVRHTPWSDRVRPHFRHTRRTMFRRLFEIQL